MKKNKIVWNGLFVAALGLCAAAAVSATQTACKTVQCGDGTVEVDGVCTASDVVPGGNCGSGTTFDPGSGKCLPNAFLCDGGDCGLCDPDTTTVAFNDAGLKFCQGTGGPGGCESDLTCPAGMSNRFHICGRIFDVEDGTRIEQAAQDNLEVHFYDALGFANSTPGNRPAPILTVKPDSCGRFSTLTPTTMAGITVPNTTFIAVATDDDPDTGNDDFILTGVALPGAFNQKADKVIAFQTRRSTDMAWSVPVFGAGQPTFSDRGVYLPIFIDPTVEPSQRTTPFPGAVVPGVTITEGGAIKAANDYYFMDTMANERKIVDPSFNTTQMNGAGLYLNGPLTMFSGSGAVPAGCTGWPSTLAASVQGVVFVQERIAEGCN